MTPDGTTYPNLFSPMKIGDLELKNRLVMSPVGTRLARDGMVTEDFKGFYTARARGGVGLIILEPCFVEPAGEGMFLSLHEDRFGSSLQGLIDDIHAIGSKIGMQLYHAGWQEGKKDARFLPPIPPAELSVERIHDLIKKFTDAARRGKEAGFDLIEIHAAHGYMLSQFLSPSANQRKDKYGLDITGRTRFLVEIIQAIREVVGEGYPLSCRINGADHVPGGLTLSDAKEVASVIEKNGIDLISVSAGSLGSYPLTIPPFDIEKGCYVPLAEGIKNVVQIPIIVAGRINTPEIAEDILRKGKANLVAMARGLVADPELPQKSINGGTDGIRKCIACNNCLDDDYEGHISCTVNPLAGRESVLDIILSPASKKVMVVGGGLAGLETARVAAIRGHQVSLYEKDITIGGQWLIAARPPHKQEFESLLSWYATQIGKNGIQLNLGSTVEPELVVQESPEVVVMATGAVALIPEIKGFEHDEVIHAWEILSGRSIAGDRVMVIGGGATGLETAEFLASQGKKVAVIEMMKRFGSDMGGTVYYHLRIRLKQLGVEMFKKTEVREVSDNGVMVLRGGLEEQWKGFDTIVLALGSKSRNELAAQISGMVNELYVVGDAAEIGNAASAIRQGMEIGMKI